MAFLELSSVQQRVCICVRMLFTKRLPIRALQGLNLPGFRDSHRIAPNVRVLRPQIDTAGSVFGCSSVNHKPAAIAVHQDAIGSCYKYDKRQADLRWPFTTFNIASLYATTTAESSAL